MLRTIHLMRYSSEEWSVAVKTFWTFLNRLFGEEGFWCNCIFRVERFLVKEAFLCIELIDAAVGWLPWLTSIAFCNSKAFVVRGFSWHLRFEIWMTCYYLNGKRQPCRSLRCQVEEEQRRKAEEAQKQASDKDFGKHLGCRCIRRILEGKPDKFQGSYILQKIIWQDLKWTSAKNGLAVKHFSWV